MPLIHVKTSAPGIADPHGLLGELSRSLAALLGKPERYMMTLLDTDMPMTFGGDRAPACYVEVKSIGALEGDRTREVSSAVCSLIERHLGIPADRTYVGFEEVPPRLWGWNGGTFG